MAVAALGLFIGAARLHEWRIHLNGTNLALVAYPTILLSSVAFAAIYSGPFIAGASLARVLLFGLSIYVFFYVSCGPGSAARIDATRAIRLLLSAGTASALFACLDFYFQFPAPAGFGDQFVWLDSGVYRRAQGLFYEASTMGNLCAFFLAMVVAALLRRHSELPVSRPLLTVAGALFGLTLLLTFSRASLANVVIATAVLAWLHRDRIRLGVAALAVTSAVTAAVFLFPEFLAAYRIRIAASFEHLFTATESVLSGRLEAWRTLGSFLWEQPWHAIFGVGYKTLPYSDFTGQPVIADNAYLSALVETGIVGLAAMLAFNVAILALAWRAKGSFLGAWVFAFWIGEMFQMLSGDLLTYWRVLPVYLFVLALAVRR